MKIKCFELFYFCKVLSLACFSFFLWLFCLALSVASKIERINQFGGHTMIQYNGTGQFRGVESINMGQVNVLARYPFHFHEMGVPNELEDVSWNNKISDTSVHDSFFRCWTIHGTNNVSIIHNTAYNIDGHCLYIEDGVEEDNRINYNAIAFVHPIAYAAGGGCFSGEYVCAGCSSGNSWASGNDAYYYFDIDELLIPADVGASCYYVSNCHNTFIGNIASGGWSGFSFINMQTPLGNYLYQDYGYLNPYFRPTIEFDGNIAHSSGIFCCYNF